MTKRSLKVLLLLFVSTITITKSTPIPPKLPYQFRQSFRMNNSKGTRISQGIVYYDWPSGQQKIIHSSNSSQCHHWWGTYEPCTEYFTPTGKVWVHFPENNTCCLESCKEGCREQSTWLPRPDYVESTNFTGYEFVDGYNCTRWNSTMVSWFTKDGIPVLFGNGKKTGGIAVYSIHYNVSSFEPGPQDPSIFYLPKECKNNFC